jgi:DNA-binding transcriptional LysR family regulator
MDLLELRYFQVIARTEHVSRAADELRVAQPSLSRALGRLEAELGLPLFDRRGRRLRLNRYGTMFLRRVDRALGELADGRRELADAAGLEQGEVAVAAESLRVLTDLLAGFLAEHPGVRFRLHQSPAPEMVRQLRAGAVDLCLASRELAGPGLASSPVLDEEVLLAAPPGHPLAGRRRVGVAELAGQPWITTRPGQWQRDLADRLFAAAGTRPAIVCEGDEPGAIRGLVSAGLGLALLPASSRDATPDPPVAWASLDAPDCRRVLRVVWRTGTYLPAAARRFRDFTTRRLA